MATNALSGIAAPSATTAPSSATQMKSEDFFKLLVSELKNQDPLQPSKTSDMISEVSQIRSIELSGDLTSALQQLSAQQRSVGAAGLLGKYVAGSDGNAQSVAGVVTGVRFSDDGSVLLELDSGLALPATQVTSVTTPENAEAASASAAGTTSKPNNQAKSTQAKAVEPHWYNLGGLLKW